MDIRVGGPAHGGWDDWVSQLEAVVERLIPRLLTQVCRDPNSAAYGCFDRDWWHYRTKDFPSVILQQGAYTAWLAWGPGGAAWPGLAATGARTPPIRELVAAACRFWNARAVRQGAFEEYYPFEQGYAPLAFSTLAVAKLVQDGVVAPEEVAGGLRVAAKQLLERFEPDAANQQVAGLAALAWLRRVNPALVPEAAFAGIAGKTLALQTPEGWFTEYGGPDLGYLSVALDCLWDCCDATGDVRFRDSAAAGLRCIGRYVEPLGGGIGMHNSRNTDYILPYGLARFLREAGEERQLAAHVLEILYGGAAEATHFLWSMDDRYLSHYAGHSLVRALPLMKAAGLGGREAAGERRIAPVDRVYDLAGHLLLAGGDRNYALIVSLKKGGILTAVGAGGTVSDYGWVVKRGRRQQVNHWWSDGWSWKRDGDRLEVRGRMIPCREYLSSSAKHTVLRLASLLLGRRLAAPLKRMLIAGARGGGCAFERIITMGTDSIIVEDRVKDVPRGAAVSRAPRASKRHVASADGFHPEDFQLAPGGQRECVSSMAGGVFTARTVYTMRPS